MDIDEINLEYQSVDFSVESYILSCRKVGYHHYNISITCGDEQLRSYTNCTDYTNYACNSTDGGKTGSRIYSSPTLRWAPHFSRLLYGSTLQDLGEVTCNCDVILYHDSSYTRTMTLNVTGITDIYMHISRTCLIFTTKAPGVRITASAVIRRTITTATINITEVTEAEGYVVSLFDRSLTQTTQEIHLNGRNNTLITIYGIIPGRQYQLFNAPKRLLVGQATTITTDFNTQHCHDSSKFDSDIANQKS